MASFRRNSVRTCTYCCIYLIYNGNNNEIYCSVISIPVVDPDVFARHCQCHNHIQVEVSGHGHHLHLHPHSTNALLYSAWNWWIYLRCQSRGQQCYSWLSRGQRNHRHGYRYSTYVYSSFSLIHLHDHVLGNLITKNEAVEAIGIRSGGAYMMENVDVVEVWHCVYHLCACMRSMMKCIDMMNDMVYHLNMCLSVCLSVCVMTYHHHHVIMLCRCGARGLSRHKRLI